MKTRKKFLYLWLSVVTAIVFLGLNGPQVVFAQVVCPPGSVPAFLGSDTCILDPLSIPKYITPLVIPPVMKKNDGVSNNYDIAVRQFQQQILPAPLPHTTIWSYGPASDPTPVVAPDPNSQFNYPAYTIETTSGTQVNVRWINELKDSSGNFLPHLLPVDQTLHWANPPQECADGTTSTDCMGMNPAPYTGPVPMVVHVHGAHVDPHSDGYPEAWWLPAATDIPAGYATKGRLFDDVTGANLGANGYADYSYRQDQPATTLWYHDHTLGMTRSNVYAGPAGFWLIRGGANDLSTGLPGPAPIAGQTVLQLNVPTNLIRQGIREIPIAIQDRSFKPNGSLFYPGNRAFFEGLNPLGGTPPALQIPLVPDPLSDIAPIWNPEAFFTTIVVNGVTWPKLEVAPALYRLRLLNGCNSRFLNLALFQVVTPNKNKPALQQLGRELPFYQIGAEQGFLPKVVQIQTGFATPLAGARITNQSQLLKAPNNQQALLMGLAERADVIVDFRGLANGTRIRMINTAPDAPFGGFPDIPADPATTGQVMEFVINSALNGKSPTDPVLAGGVTPNPNAATDPWLLALPAESALGVASVTRNVSLNEEESAVLCVTFDKAGNLVPVPGAVPPLCLDPAPANLNNPKPVGFPMAPKAALLGQVGTDPLTGLPIGIPLKWTDMTGTSTPKMVDLQSGLQVMVNVTENPAVGAIEDWDIYNFTVDAHPIHLHLVRFQVIARGPVGTVLIPGVGVQPWETGFKDTVIAFPGEITRVRATFDIPGLYVWHCHIVEHEDNEMMRPYFVEP